MAESIDGILLLDKPRGMTSNAALQAVKRLLGARKAGHGGTLDPMASGLLPIFFGEATKFAGILLDAEKSYAAELQLGITTTTGDVEGEVIDRRPVVVTDDLLGAVLRSFIGHYEQVAPAYSALKHRGRPHYEYARAGIEVPRPRRRVAIADLTLDSREGNVVRLTVTCSKGTYIRSLAEDIGEGLGCGAHLSGLRRLATGAFQISEAWTLDEMDRASIACRRSRLISPDAPLSTLPRLLLTPEQSLRLRQGQRIVAAPGAVTGSVRIYEITGAFIGLGEITGEGQVSPRRLVAGSLGRSDKPPALATGASEDLNLWTTQGKR